VATVRIYELVIEPSREDHIARHHVDVEEVEDAVFTGSSLPERVRTPSGVDINNTGATRPMADTDQGMSPPGRHATSRIPTFSKIEEEAEFWDNHDITEFEDELELVTDVTFVTASSRHRGTPSSSAQTSPADSGQSSARRRSAAGRPPGHS